MSTATDRVLRSKCPAAFGKAVRCGAKRRPLRRRSRTGSRPRIHNRAPSLPPSILLFSLIGGASAALVGAWGNMVAGAVLLIVMSVGILIYIASLPKSQDRQPGPSGDLRNLEPERMLRTLRHDAEAETKDGESKASHHAAATGLAAAGLAAIATSDDTTGTGDETPASTNGPTGADDTGTPGS